MPKGIGLRLLGREPPKPGGPQMASRLFESAAAPDRKKSLLGAGGVLGQVHRPASAASGEKAEDVIVPPIPKEHLVQVPLDEQHSIILNQVEGILNAGGKIEDHAYQDALSRALNEINAVAKARGLPVVKYIPEKIDFSNIRKGPFGKQIWGKNAKAKTDAIKDQIKAIRGSVEEIVSDEDFLAAEEAALTKEFNALRGRGPASGEVITASESIGRELQSRIGFTQSLIGGRPGPGRSLLAGAEEDNKNKSKNRLGG